jgi:hypothetical protein
VPSRPMKSSSNFLRIGLEPRDDCSGAFVLGVVPASMKARSSSDRSGTSVRAGCFGLVADPCLATENSRNEDGQRVGSACKATRLSVGQQSA